MNKAAVLMAVVLLIAGCVKTQGDKMENVVVIETSKGNIEVALDADKAPITVANFLKYANEGFYDGTIFHRVIPRFMIQGGGFMPDGSEKETHAPIKLESKNGLKNAVGTIAMARTNVPDSATSQFFINLVNNSFLDYRPGNDGYAVFGTVVKGMDVVQAIGMVRTASKGYNDDWPVEDVVIKRVYMKK
jgi:peptidyl-prolyl cis-trans isomerase B (cyclophilin B)